MDISSILISMAGMGGLGILFSAGLSIAHKKLYVEDDPRIQLVVDELPGVNCGGCGYPGCANFAENLVAGVVALSDCPVSDDDSKGEIAAVLGIEAVAGEKLIARLMCRGGHNESARRALYAGLESCLAAHVMGGGDRLCSYGCIGYGDCVKACPFDAMVMDANGLPVIFEDRCTACGNCVKACPRDVIELHPVDHRLFVFCKNTDSPKEARQTCIAACIGCGICVRAVEDGQIVMENNLARIDYTNFGREEVIPTDKCSTKALNVIPGKYDQPEVEA